MIVSMVFEAEKISWPGWEVVGKLGEGSFGGVYEIQRTLPDGTVERAALKKLTVPRDPAEIKELYAQNYDSASITEHFKEQMQELVQEYRFMQELSRNSYVVHCQDLRTIQHDDGIGWDIYIQMELLTPLKAWLTEWYDERKVVRLGLNLCGALNGCHQRNIIHRDIKPENILVTEDGKFKLGDFGIAKVSEKTATGTLTGTYSYMAPEVANRQHYGASADIYSLGLVMYWMMNERTLPFLPLSKKIPSGLQRQEAQDRRFSGEEIPAPLNGSLELTRIVLKACAFNPEDRYHSVQEMAEDLKWHYQNLRSGMVRRPKPSNRQPTGSWDEPTIGTEKTYVPPQQEEPSKKKRNLWKPFLIAGIATVLLTVLLGYVVSSFINNSPKNDSVSGNTSSSVLMESHPQNLMGTWYSFYDLNDIDSLADDPFLEISEDGVCFPEIKTEPLAWSVQDNILTIPDLNESFTVINVDEITILQNKHTKLISADILENHKDQIILSVTLTKDNVLDYFEFCTGTIDHRDQFGVLNGYYSRSVYLRPKTIPGYVFWGDDWEDSIAIKIEIPEHSYRTRNLETNQQSTIRREEKSERILSYYPFEVAQIIDGSDSYIRENDLDLQTNFSITDAKGTIRLLAEGFFQEWEIEENGYDDGSLIGKDIFGGTCYLGAFVAGVAPDSTERSEYDITVEPFGNATDVSESNQGVARKLVQEPDHICPGYLGCFCIENGTKMKLVCMGFGDYEKTVDAIPITMLPRENQSISQYPAVGTKNQLIWKMEPNTEQKITLLLGGKTKYYALHAAVTENSRVFLDVFVDGTLLSSGEISDTYLSNAIIGAQELELRLKNENAETSIAIQGCVSLLENPASGGTLLGTGTEETPYCIYTAEDFLKIQENLDAHYALMQDIEFSSETVVRPMGEGGYRYPNWSSKGGFSGILDGNGHKISGVRIVSPKQCGGLFTSIDETGVVKNLVLDCEISSEVVDMDNALGGITGYNNGTIQNCTVNAVGGTEGIYCMIGCIAGANHGEIMGCKTTGKLSAYGNYAKAGGIVGIQIANARSPLVDCDTEAIRAYSGKIMPLVGYTQS